MSKQAALERAKQAEDATKTGRLYLGLLLLVDAVKELAKDDEPKPEASSSTTEPSKT